MVIEGFREGERDDFVSKPFCIEELMEKNSSRVETRKTRSLVHAPQSQELICGALRLLPGPRQCYVKDALVKLTDRD